MLFFFRGKKSHTFVFLLGLEAHWRWHAWDFIQKAILGFHSREQDLHRHQFWATLGVTPCWEAATNYRRAPCFRNWRWITAGRPHRAGHPQARTHQCHQASPRSSSRAPHGTGTAWPSKEAALSSTAKEGDPLLHHGEESWGPVLHKVHQGQSTARGHSESGGPLPSNPCQGCLAHIASRHHSAFLNPVITTTGTNRGKKIQMPSTNLSYNLMYDGNAQMQRIWELMVKEREQERKHGPRSFWE